jgi:Ca-activated chloride channel family protein
MTRTLISVILILFVLSANGQNEHKITRKGNKLYEKNQYADAEANYKKALEIDPKHYQASFNLGDAYFKQERFDEAITQFTIAAHATEKDELKNKAYYNLGNANLEAFKKLSSSNQQEDMKKKSAYLDKSIEAYKQALRINPRDENAKYNLSYALKHKNEGGGGQSQQQDKQDQQQEKKDENKQQEKNKQKDQNKEDQQKDKQQQDQQKEQKMDKQEAEQLLKKQGEKEKEVQAKVMKKKQKPKRVKVEKEW